MSSKLFKNVTNKLFDYKSYLIYMGMNRIWH